MTVYDIPNIEHCRVEVISDTIVRLWANEGWYIHKSDDPPIEDDYGNQIGVAYRTVVIIFIDREDLSGIEITAEADLPPGSQIFGIGDNTNHEVM